jgi:hypothetical protein
MLIPRFSIRWLLGLTTFSAGISLVLAYAVRGNPWAIGIVAGLWTVVIIALFYSAAFLSAWLFNQFVAGPLARPRQTSDSPFAAPQPASAPFALAPQPAADSPPPMTG